jgi:hypothetical protein
MAEVTIRLRHNRKTQERELVVHYESDADALPHEHERDHQRIAEELLGARLGELMNTHQIDRVVVETAPPQIANAEPEPTVEKQALLGGNTR